jgi:hypothetical protein
MQHPWKKLPKETSKAFAAFHAYLGLGPERSLEAAGKKVGKCSKVLERWSKKFGWGDRAKEYDAHWVKVEEEAREVEYRAKAIDWLKRQYDEKEAEWELTRKVLEKIRRFLALDDTEMTFRDAVYGLELASRVARLAAGMPNEISDASLQVGPVIQIDVEAALERAYGSEPQTPEPKPKLLKAEEEPSPCPVVRPAPAEREAKPGEALTLPSPSGEGNALPLPERN